MSKKMTKAEAQYREGHGRFRCKLCTMFRKRFRHANSCTAVEGAIGAMDLCKLFDRATTVHEKRLMGVEL